jgi:hypothetical protein
MKQIPIGIIPNGDNNNSLIKTISDQSGEEITPEAFAYIICKGFVKTFDLLEIQSFSRKQPIYSVDFLSWGLITDIKNGSKKYENLYLN